MEHDLGIKDVKQQTPTDALQLRLQVSWQGLGSDVSNVQGRM
jgi:hypothetical protein